MRYLFDLVVFGVGFGCAFGVFKDAGLAGVAGLILAGIAEAAMPTTDAKKT